MSHPPPVAAQQSKSVEPRWLGKVYIIKDDGHKYWLTVIDDNKTVKFVKEPSDLNSITDWYFVGLVFHRPYMFNVCDAGKQPLCWHGPETGLSMSQQPTPGSNTLQGGSSSNSSSPQGGGSNNTPVQAITCKFHDDNSLALYIGTGQQLPFNAYWYRSAIDDGSGLEASQPQFDLPAVQDKRPYMRWYNVVFWLALFIILIALIILLFIAIAGLSQQQLLMSSWLGQSPTSTSIV